MATEESGFVGWLKSRSGLVFLGFAAIALFFLWEEHKAHILDVLPYALLLLAPSCISFMAGMEVTEVRMTNIRVIVEPARQLFLGGKDGRGTCVRFVVARYHQLVSFHYFRF
jgi:Protein of unknown function (DUF2933)